MARLTDHAVRDAEHVIRTEVALLLGKYGRRIIETSKADVQGKLEEAAKEERDVDATALGRAAVYRAAFPYFGDISCSPVLEIVEGSPSST